MTREHIPEWVMYMLGLLCVFGIPLVAFVIYTLAEWGRKRGGV